MILGCCIGFTANAQCDFLKNEKDEFTGDVVKMQKEYEVNRKVFKSRFWFSIAFSKINDTYFLMLRYTSGQRPDMINAGNELFIKLNNDEMIKLETISSYITDAKHSQYGSVYNISPHYGINIEDLEKIKEIGIAKIRMYTSKLYYEGDFLDKDNGMVKELIMCITQ